MLQQLAKLADHLDRNGLRAEADFVDQIIVEASIVSKLVNQLKSVKDKSPEIVLKLLLKIGPAIKFLRDHVKKLKGKLGKDKQASLFIDTTADTMQQLKEIGLIVSLVLSLISGVSSQVKNEQYKKDIMALKDAVISLEADLELEKGVTDQLLDDELGHLPQGPSFTGM